MKSNPSSHPDHGQDKQSVTSSAGLRLWDEQPLLRPHADPSMPRLPWAQRGAQVLLHSLARLEYWLSPSGWLRAWLRLNLLVTVILAVASVTLLPVITVVLTEVAGWTGLASDMVGYLTQAVTNLPPIAVAIGAVLLGTHLYRVYRTRKRRRGYFQSDSYDDDYQ